MAKENNLKINKIANIFNSILSKTKQFFLVLKNKIRNMLIIILKIISNKTIYFFLINVVLFLLIGLFFYFDLNNTLNLKFNSDLQIVCQVIISLVICIVTVISISLSIQNDEIFGIKGKDFFNLRVMPYFSFLAIILISIILSIFSIISMAMKLYTTHIYIEILSLSYGIWFVCLEIPLLSRTENSIFNLIKNTLKNRILTSKVQTSKNKNNLNIVLNEIINIYGIQETYNKLSIKRKPNSYLHKSYNITLLKNLLDERINYISNLSDSENKEKVTRIFDGTFADMKKIFGGNFKIDTILGTNETYSYFFTRIIFAMSNSHIYDKFDDQIESLIFQLLAISDYNEKKDIDENFINDIITALIKCPTEKGEMWALEAFRKNYSKLTFSLHLNDKYKKSTLYFATICWYLYYLCEKESYLDGETKQKIREFVCRPSQIDKNKKYYSWTELYSDFMMNASIKLDDLLRVYKDSIYWEYHLDGIAKSVILSSNFIINWFFEAKINSYTFYNYNIEDIKNYDKRIQNKIKSVLDSWFDNEKNLVHKQFSQYQNFYNYKPSHDNYFIENKELQLKWFDLKNDLKETDLMESLTEYNTDNNVLQQDMRKFIENKIFSYWGYKDSLDLEQEKQLYFYSYLEKLNTDTEEGRNYYIETIGNGYATSIWQGIHQKLRYTILKNSDSNAINKIIKMNPDYKKGADDYSHYLENFEDSEKYKNFLKNIKTIPSPSFFPENTFIKTGAFEYNVIFDDFIINSLTEEQINQVIKDNYTKPDGQYFFDGVYLTREKLYELIKKKFITIKIIFRFKVKINKNNILVWDIWGIEESKCKRKTTKKTIN